MITGTNGKTTTATLLGKILEAHGEPNAILTNAFYKLGTEFEYPDGESKETAFQAQETLRRIRNEGTKHIIIEQSAQDLYEHKFSGTAYQVAVLTNFTEKNSSYFGDMHSRAYATAKLLTRGASLHVINSDDKWYDYFEEYEGRDTTVTFGTGKKAICKIVKAKITSCGQHVVGIRFAD